LAGVGPAIFVVVDQKQKSHHGFSSPLRRMIDSEIDTPRRKKFASIKVGLPLRLCAKTKNCAALANGAALCQYDVSYGQCDVRLW